jgi:hypothetical protein
MKFDIKPSDFAKSILRLKGKPLSFNGYEPFIPVYDITPKSLVLVAGRQ